MKRINSVWIGSVALLLGSLVTTILLLEGVLRFTQFQRLIATVRVPRFYYRPDLGRGFDIAPNFPTSTISFAGMTYPIWSNELGCFDRSYQGERPSIYLAGDSFTWGFAPYEAKWGTRLEVFTGVRTLKCGVGGYGTKQELLKAQEILTRVPAPRLVLLAYFRENDPEDDFSFPNKLVYDGYLLKKPEGDTKRSFEEMQSRLPDLYTYGSRYCMQTRPAHPALQRVKCLLTRHSITYLLLKNGIKQWISVDHLQKVGVVNAPVVDSVPLTTTDTQAHLQHLREMQEFAKSKGSDFLVVLVPPMQDVQISPGTPDPEQALKEYLVTARIPYLDLREDFQRVDPTARSLYWEGDPHWNVRGNQLASLLIGRAVLDRSAWIPHRDEKRAELEQLIKQEFPLLSP